MVKGLINANFMHFSSLHFWFHCRVSYHLQWGSTLTVSLTIRYPFFKRLPLDRIEKYEREGEMQGEVQEENWKRKAGRLETAQQAVQVAGNQQEEEEEEEERRHQQQTLFCLIFLKCHLH